MKKHLKEQLLGVVAILAICGGWAVAAAAQPEAAETIEFSSLVDGEAWEYVAGEHTLRAQRQGDLVQVRLHEGDEGVEAEPIFSCRVDRFQCSASVEDSNEPPTISLIKDGAEEKFQVLVAVEEDRLRVVAGMGSSAL